MADPRDAAKTVLVRDKDGKVVVCQHVVWRGFNVRTLCSRPMGHPGSCS